jgi:hypothetical protein
MLIPFNQGARSVEAAAGGITYLGVTNGQTTTLSFPVGTSAGDLAVVLAVDALSGVPALSGWSSETSFNADTTSSVDCFMFYKTLSAGDISSPPSFTGSGTYLIWAAMIFPGGTAIERGTPGAISTASTITIPAKTPRGDSEFVIAFGGSRKNSPAATVDSGFTKEVGVTDSGISSLFAAQIATGSYDSGSVDWTGVGTVYGAAGVLIDVY